MKRIWTYFALLLALAGLAGPLAAPTGLAAAPNPQPNGPIGPTADGLLSGRVTDLELGCATPPCSEALVHVAPIGLEVPVDPLTGWYTATLPEAVYTLTASAEGYAGGGPYTVTVVSGTVSYLDFCLARPAIEVDPLSIQAAAPPGVLVSRTLTLSNSGHHTLSWSIQEVAPKAGAGERIVLGPAYRGLDPYIEQELHTSADGRADVRIALDGVVDLSPATRLDWQSRGAYVYGALQARAESAQAGVRAWLEERGIDYSVDLAGNTIMARLSGGQIAALAGLEGVAGFGGNHVHAIAPVIEGEPSPSAPPNLTWGVDRIEADLVWDEFGVRGEGVVVANIDTGVEWDHDALVGQFRCPGDPGDNACWEDPENGCGGTACDDNGHGTHVMGTMVALDDPALTWSAGVAPGAEWIACKGCSSMGACTDFALTSCANWALAPAGDPANRPHVINNSWGDLGCDDWFLPYILPWQAAGIFSTFSPGGGGPSCGTIGSPADYAQTFAAGATDSSDFIASFSGRGPSCFTNRAKPDVSAPGVSIWSTYPGNTWANYSGTSMSPPHLAGQAALIWSANPALVGDLLATAYIITYSAECQQDLSCGGVPCAGRDPLGWNNVYGYGIINAYRAVSMAISPTDLPWVWEWPTSGTVAPTDTVQVEVGLSCTPSDTGRLLSGTLRIEHNDPCVEAVSVSLQFRCRSTCVTATILAVETDVHSCWVTLSAAISGTPPIDYHWDFGDGYTSTLTTPTHGYHEAGAGSYTVTLQACNCGGCDELATPLSIEDDPPSNLALSWLPLAPSVGESVTFSGGAEGSEPLDYAWAIDGVHAADTPTFTHAFSQAGDYTIAFSASNDCWWDAISDSLTVLSACVEAEIGDIQHEGVGCELDFSAEVSGTPPIDYHWDFGDGYTSTLTTPTHAYSESGAYTVTLEVRNCDGAGYDALKVPVACQVCEPPANLELGWSPLQPGVGVEVTFSGSADGSAPLNYEWWFDCALYSLGMTTTRTFSQNGDYEVAFRAYNDCGDETVSDTLTVLSETVCVPVDILGVSSEISGCRVSLEADYGGDTPLSFLWEFGDGYTSTAAAPTHTYAPPGGAYSATLHMENCGGEGYDTYEFSLNAACPEDRFYIYLPLVVRGTIGR